MFEHGVVKYESIVFNEVSCDQIYRITADEFSRRAVAMIQVGRFREWLGSISSLRYIWVDGIENFIDKSQTAEAFADWIRTAIKNGAKVQLTSRWSVDLSLLGLGELGKFQA